MKHDTIPGRVYAIRCKAPTTVTCSRNKEVYTLLSHPGDESEMYFTAISTSVSITSSGSYALQETFNSAPTASSGGGGDFNPSELQRKVKTYVCTNEVTDYVDYSQTDDRSIIRVSADGTKVFSAIFAKPSEGKSYEVVFEFTPLSSTTNFNFGGDLGVPEWQFVDQAPKPTSWEVGKTYCFTVLYIDGITAPLVATSYTRDIQA